MSNSNNTFLCIEASDVPTTDTHVIYASQSSHCDVPRRDRDERLNTEGPTYRGPISQVRPTLLVGQRQDRLLPSSGRSLPIPPLSGTQAPSGRHSLINESKLAIAHNSRRTVTPVKNSILFDGLFEERVHVCCVASAILADASLSLAGSGRNHSSNAKY